MTLNSYLSWHGYMLYYHNLRSHFMQFTERWMTTHYQFQLIGLDKFPNTVHGKGICRWMGSDSLHQRIFSTRNETRNFSSTENKSFSLYTTLKRTSMCKAFFRLLLDVWTILFKQNETQTIISGYNSSVMFFSHTSFWGLFFFF